MRIKAVGRGDVGGSPAVLTLGATLKWMRVYFNVDQKDSLALGQLGFVARGAAASATSTSDGTVRFRGMS